MALCNRAFGNAMRTYVLAVASAFAAAEPAWAADLALEPIPAVSLYSWTGIYGGLQLGGGWDQSTWRLFSQNGSGAFYGGQLGYNYQIGQFVLGAESDLAGSTLQASSICAAVAGSNCQTQLNYLASARGRVGFAVDRLMIYGDGGAAFGGFRFAETAVLMQNWAGQVHVGWTVGGGVEYAFTNHLIGGVEYNYYGFPSVTLGGGVNPTTINPRESLNTMMAKASYKF
jgi:outer membrane immunogenic protein